MHDRPRRFFIRLLPMLVAVILPASTLLTLTACRRVSVYTSTYLDVFDTVLTVSIPVADRKEAETHATAIHELVLELHRDLDIYHHYDGRNNLHDLNEAAGGEALPVSDAILDVLDMGRVYYERTNGQLNVCLGAVLRLWHDARTAGDRIPGADRIAEALTASTSIDALVIDRRAGTAQITDPRVSVDVGALAKGYVMSRVEDYAHENGIASILVNLGGHVWALGERPDGHPWTVSVRDPVDPSAAGFTVEASDVSVVTSGDYIRVFEVDGHAYHHIIDPATGYPADRYHAVTVTVPTTHTDEADALSTALFLMSIQEGYGLLASIPGATAVWTSTDGTVTDSSTLDIQNHSEKGLP